MISFYRKPGTKEHTDNLLSRQLVRSIIYRSLLSPLLGVSRLLMILHFPYVVFIRRHLGRISHFGPTLVAHTTCRGHLLWL